VKIRLFSVVENSPLDAKNVYWTWHDLFRLTALYVVAQLVMMVLLTQILTRQFYLEEAVAFFVVYVAALLVVVPFVGHYGFWPQSVYLGLSWADFRRNFWQGIGYGLAYRLLPSLPVLVIVLFWTLLGHPPELPPGNNPVAGQLVFSATWFAGFLRAVVLAPVVEEYFYRGLLYPLLRSAHGVRKAIVISSVLFGIMHGVSLIGFWAVFAGIGMALAYENTGSLATPIIAHMLVNAIAILAVGF